MKRHLFKLALFLLLGAVVNVAVSWGCALWSHPTSSKILSDAVATGYFTKRQMLEGPIKVRQAYVQTGMGRLYHKMIANEGGAFTRKAFLARLDTGWPELALSAEWRAKGGEAAYLPLLPQLHSGFEVKFIRGQHARTAFGMPSSPIWPGFAINTIFYAAILWLLTLGPFTARRMIRHKRGLCIKCGYDLRETPDKCPECGWGREAEA